jgi:hypothetical protein
LVERTLDPYGQCREPADARVSRVTKTLARAVLPAVVLGALAGAAVLISKDPFASDSTHVEAAKTLAVAHPQQQLPGAGTQRLRLQATGGEECPGTAHVTAIKTRETDAAVLVSASFRIEPSGYCELRTAMGHFEISLRRPLGQRVVIDDSRGRRRIIWSPELLGKNRATAELTDSDALRFATSRFPQAAPSRCIPVGPYFECRYIRAGQRYRLILRKEPGGTFSVFDRPIPDPTCPFRAGIQRGCP